MRFSKRELRLILVLFILSVSFLYYHFLLGPVYSDYIEIKKQNQEMEILWQNFQNSISISSDQPNKQEGYQDYLYKIPEKPYCPEIMAYMSETAKESSVVLKGLKVDIPSVNSRASDSSGLVEKLSGKDSVPKPIAIDVQAEGYYYNLMTFILKLENNDRLYAIKECTFTSGKKARLDQKNNANVNPEEKSGMLELSLPTTTYSDNIVIMRLKAEAYYEEYNPLGIKGIKNEIVPVENPKNPFL